MDSTTRLSAFVLTAALLTACGSGGGGGGSFNNTPPPSTNNPDPTPQPSPDPEPTPDPEPEPEPEPEPKTGFDLYKEGIEEMVAAVVMLEKIGKSDVGRIPQLVADQVTAHGPASVCGDDVCRPTEDYVVTLPNGQEVTIHWWVDVNGDGKYGHTDEVLVYTYTDIDGISGSSMSKYDTEWAQWAFAIGAQYSDQTRYGLKVGSTDSLQYGAILFTRELGDGRIRIGDFEFGVGERVPTQTFHRVRGEEHVALETYGHVDSNLADMDAIDANIEWFPAFFGGLLQKLKTTTSLDFDTVDGKLVFEGGSFVYTEEPVEGGIVTVQLAVDADPAFLAWQLDEDGDGTFELSGRVAQSDFRYILP